MSTSPKKRFTPTPEQRKAADPAHSVWVAASAGSGKTQVLVDRVIRLLLEGAAPDAILCLTFTKAAAAEMQNRLFQRLGDWTGLPDKDLDETLQNLGVEDLSPAKRAAARRLFARALETPGGLKIQTIHAFCEKLLQLFPVESGMAPGFRVMEEQETRALFRQSLLLALNIDPEAATTWSVLDDGSITSLEALETLARKFLSASSGMRQRLSDMETLAETEVALKDILGIRNEHTAGEIVNEICELDSKAYDAAIRGLMPLEADASHCAPKFLQRALDAVTPLQRLEHLRAMLLTGKGERRKSVLRKPAAKAEPALAAWLEAEAARVLDLLQELAKQHVFSVNLSLYRAMATVLAFVNTSKRARGVYDFDDLIARAAQLLSGHEAAQWVLYKLDRGLTHILVDEAQDTSPAQWTIIKALAGEFFTGSRDPGTHRTVFAVGDLKQSIYSFQGADIEAFEAARISFATSLAAVQQKLEVVDLAVSYRSNQQVLDTVDRVFAPTSDARKGFGPRAEHERPHTAFKDKQIGLVEFWDLELADDSEVQDNWRAPVDEPARNHPRLKLAERIASTIKGWIGKRRLAGHDRAVQAGDILILLQSRNALFNGLISALRRHGVPVAGADRLKLQESLIIQDMLALGQFIRMPAEDHTLACLLKSPLVPEPLNEDQVFALAHARGSASLWSRLPEVSHNRNMLAQALASTDTPFMLFQQVLQQSRRAILERLGQEAEDASQEFLTLALDYEQQSGTSLSGFLDWFRQGETQIKREMEQGSGQLRLMTVHGSKGLEAPIVFLADAADPPPSNKDRLITVMSEGPWRNMLLFNPDTEMKVDVVEALKEEEKQARLQERLRLLYVGMTRAADELYICGSVNKDDEDKRSKLSWHVHVTQAFAEATGLSDLMRDEGARLVRFGATPEFIEHPQQAPAQPDALPDWAITPVASVLSPGLPLTSSRSSDAFDKQAVAEGIATHRLIELMANAAPGQRLEKGRRWASRLNLSEECADILHAALELPDLAPMFGPNGQSEVTVEGMVPGIGRVSGRIDRMAVEAETIWILDYKTNRNPPRSIGPGHSFARQMALYAALLREAYPGHSVRAALLWTQNAEVMWLSDGLLSQALDQANQETA